MGKCPFKGPATIQHSVDFDLRADRWSVCMASGANTIATFYDRGMAKWLRDAINEKLARSRGEGE